MLQSYNAKTIRIVNCLMPHKTKPLQFIEGSEYYFLLFFLT